MFRFKPTVVVLALFAAACRPNSNLNHVSDSAALQKVDDAYVDAVPSQDWAGLAALFETDAVLMPPNEATVVGRDAILARGESFRFAAVDYAPLAGCEG